MVSFDKLASIKSFRYKGVAYLTASDFKRVQVVGVL